MLNQEKEVNDKIKIEKSMVSNSSKICNINSYVIIKIRNKMRLVQVKDDRPVFVGKQKLNLKGLIGQPFNSYFEIKNHSLIPVPKPDLKSTIKVQPQSSAPDNRHLKEDQASQKLTKDCIEQLKSQGASGEAIVENLVQNSVTFNEKTRFSQDKYVKKKQEKYCMYAQALRPTARLLNEMYYSQDPLKISNLRADSLGQMLSRANVRPGGSYLVLDEVHGLLVAAVLERVGARGSVVQLYHGSGPTTSFRQAVEGLNWDADILSQVLFGLPLSRALDLEGVKLKKDLPSEESSLDSSQNGSHPLEEDEEMPLPKEKCFEDNQKIDDERSEIWAKEVRRRQRRSLRQLEQEIALQKLKQKSFDGFLAACKLYNPTTINELVGFLSPSSPFAIFAPYMESLVTCYSTLKEDGQALSLSLSENWYRKYQVLPERTHPEIRMSGCGGFLLSGIKVLPRKGS